jgi:hypothetical protein
LYFVLVSFPVVGALDVSCDSEEVCSAEWGAVTDAALYVVGFSSDDGELTGGVMCTSDSTSCDVAMPRCLPAGHQLVVDAIDSDGTLLETSDAVDVPSDVGSLAGGVDLDENVNVQPISSSKLNVTWSRLDKVRVLP